jgi:S-adenosylmethionine:tRNA ribosyltransferase-isomerase
MKTSDFDFYLPESLIAQHPTPNRSASRLLYVKAISGEVSDHTFTDFPDFLNAGDLVILNNTRVIKARLFGEKFTGGQVEVLIERVLDSHRAYAHVRASRSPKVGSKITLASAFEVQVIGRHDDLFELQVLSDTPILELLEQYGALPLPPYITHAATQEDETRYQTVFSQHLGAVAAPTAGLHFTEEILEKIRQKGVGIAYVTLHVGAGTFQPVRVENITDHKMHGEIYVIPEETAAAIRATKQHGRRVVAIGTTVLRALESAAQHVTPEQTIKTGQDETHIFITPGFKFKIVDCLFTNFHLPKSTLLMLVSAFAGFDKIRKAYAHAIEKKYRFFSYGDAMLLNCENNEHSSSKID